MKEKKFNVEVRLDHFEIAAMGWKVRDTFAEVERLKIGDRYCYRAKVLIHACYVGQPPLNDFGSESLRAPALIVRCEVKGWSESPSLGSFTAPSVEDSGMEAAFVVEMYLGYHEEKFKRSDFSIEVTTVDGGAVSDTGYISAVEAIEVVAGTECEGFEGNISLDYVRLLKCKSDLDRYDEEYTLVAEGEIFSYSIDLEELYGFPTPVFGLFDRDSNLIHRVEFYPRWSFPWNVGRAKRFAISERIYDLKDLEDVDEAVLVFVQE